MDLEFAGQGSTLKAKLRLLKGGKLKSGETGWFGRDVLDWKHGWKLWVQVSITSPKPDKQYGGAIKLPSEDTEAVCFRLNDYRVATNLRSEDFELRFSLPDCLHAFKKSSAFGMTAGGLILTSEGEFWCQCRIETRGPKDGTYLEREGSTLRLKSPTANGDSRICFEESDRLPNPNQEAWARLKALKS